MLLEIARSYPDVLNTIGVIGFLVYIISFNLVQSDRLCGNGILYAALNVCAASLVLVSLIAAFNLASFLIQTSFIAIGLFGIIRKLAKVTEKAPPHSKSHLHH